MGPISRFLLEDLGVIVTLEAPEQKQVGFLDWQRDKFLLKGETLKGAEACLSLIKSCLVSIETSDSVGKINFKDLEDLDLRLSSILFEPKFNSSLGPLRQRLIEICYQFVHGFRYGFLDQNGNPIPNLKVLPI